jgi:glycogen(starch) synthase
MEKVTMSIGEKSHLRNHNMRSAAKTRSMNICLISEECPPESGWGGIGTYVYNIALGLAELGHRVHVIARGWGDDAVYEAGGVRVYRLSIPEPSWRRGTYFVNSRFGETRQILFWNQRVNQMVRRISAAERLDVIESPEYHAQGLFTTLRQRHIPMVVKLHTPAYLLHRINGVTAGWSRWDTRVSEHLEYRLVRRAPLITSPSQKLAEDVAREWRLDRSAIRVIPNPIDEELFRCTDHVEPDGSTVLYVGRIERRKGVEALVDALPAILKAFPGTRARFVGRDHPSGPSGQLMSIHLRHRLRDAGTSEAVMQFTGSVERTALPKIYRDAAVCVIPSLYENFPSTCLEAMASGCAVVASAVGGIPEIITDQVNGLLVPPNRPEVLAEAVMRLLSDPPLRRRLGDEAATTIRNRFDRSVICEEIARTYRSAMV